VLFSPTHKCIVFFLLFFRHIFSPYKNFVSITIIAAIAMIIPTVFAIIGLAISIVVGITFASAS
jgi:small basic protein